MFLMGLLLSFISRSIFFFVLFWFLLKLRLGMTVALRMPARERKRRKIFVSKLFTVQYNVNGGFGGYCYCFTGTFSNSVI